MQGLYCYQNLTQGVIKTQSMLIKPKKGIAALRAAIPFLGFDLVFPNDKVRLDRLFIQCTAFGGLGDLYLIGCVIIGAEPR